MRLRLAGVILLFPLFAWAEDRPLTLEEALSAANEPYPQLDAAVADVNLALADQQLAASQNDLSLSLDGAVRRGMPTTGPDEGQWAANNSLRLVARKTLLDFGRTSRSVDAARLETMARQFNLLETKDVRRINIMARFFDVLLADMQFAASNEYMAVAYTRWDDAKSRFELGQISQTDLSQLEAQYQDYRERRNQADQKVRSSRKKLADALNRPNEIPRDLEFPKLQQNEIDLPGYEALLPIALESNPALRSLRAQTRSTTLRAEAVRSERSPILDAELAGANYSRESTTLDRLSAGLVVSWPLYQGERVDARIAREVAQRDKLGAQFAQAKLDLTEQLMDVLNEIEWLRTASRPAALTQVNYRDLALERARAEYEMEFKTNLGFAMADTQAAAIRKKQVEYRLALALARLEALVGEPLDVIVARTKAKEKS
ncbi:MAG: TolC family protein [Thiobacillaceae bacterium]